MKKLIEILKSETESLRVQFIEKQVEIATKNYLDAASRKDWTIYDYCDFFEVMPRIREDKATKYTPSCYIFPDRFSSTEKGIKYNKMVSFSQLTERVSLEKFLWVAKQNAETYYQQSVKKLAARLEKKNLNLETLKASTTHIGVNISTTLTDGNQTVRAFTIVAEGEINKAHYRYLIK